MYFKKSFLCNNFLRTTLSDGFSSIELDREDCLTTYHTGSTNDAPCGDSIGFVCEYDIYGTGHVASNATAAGVVLRGSYIEVGFNVNGTIGVM